MAKMKKVRFHRRSRRAGEYAAPRVSIRNHCLECVGYQQAEVLNCQSRECWLWPWRMGYGASPAQLLSDEVRGGPSAAPNAGKTPRKTGIS